MQAAFPQNTIMLQTAIAKPLLQSRHSRAWRDLRRADRRGTLADPGRRLTSSGRDGDDRSTDGGGGQKHYPKTTGGQFWGRWKSASAAGLPDAPPGALRKKRQSRVGSRRWQVYKTEPWGQREQHTFFKMYCSMLSA